MSRSFDVIEVAWLENNEKLILVMVSHSDLNRAHLEIKYHTLLEFWSHSPNIRQETRISIYMLN